MAKSWYIFEPRSAAIASGLVVLAYFVIRAYKATRRPINFPPGPKTTPFLGNILSIPRENAFRTFTEWSKEYGPIIGLKTGPANMVILQDPEDAHELLDRRGVRYSGRPYNYVALNHVYDRDVGQVFLFQRNDQKLKKWKRAGRFILSGAGIEFLMPVIDAMSSRAVKSFAEKPEEFVQNVKVWSIGAPIVALSGQMDLSPELLRIFFRRQYLLSELFEPGRAPPVDFIIPLRWIPTTWVSWKKHAEFVRQETDALYAEMISKGRNSRKQRETGERIGQYQAAIARLMDEGMDEREIKWLMGGLLDAGSDTTGVTTVNFLLAMAAHPQILEKAREEIDRVCGERMPQPQDIAALAYIKACMMETLRWRPTLPLGLPHVNDKDDTYKGFVIPAGTSVIINTYAILHNPEIHPNPEVFDPTRYLTVDMQTDAKTRSTLVFGAGRRRCSGEQFVMQNMPLMMAKMIWAFDMSLPEGTDLSIESAFDVGLSMRLKKHVKINLSVRNGRMGGIREAVKKAEQELEAFLHGKK